MADAAACNIIYLFACYCWDFLSLPIHWGKYQITFAPKYSMSFWIFHMELVARLKNVVNLLAPMFLCDIEMFLYAAGSIAYVRLSQAFLPEILSWWWADQENCRLLRLIIDKPVNIANWPINRYLPNILKSKRKIEEWPKLKLQN